MAYRVDIAPVALQDAEDAYLWLKFYSTTEAAGEWYEGLLAAIFSLENSPLRCPHAPENKEFGREVRQMLYGNRSRQYRIVFGFLFDDETGEDIVRIYRIRHIRQRRLTLEEIQEGDPSSPI